MSFFPSFKSSFPFLNIKFSYVFQSKIYDQYTLHKSYSVLVPVSRTSRYLFGHKKLFYVCRVFIQYQCFNDFENDTMKLKEKK